MGSLWGRFGVTLSLLGGTWEALGVHWELVGTSLGMFWGLKVLFGGLWRDLGRALGAYKQGTLIFASETKARATKQHKRRGRKEGAGRVQGGCEEGAGRVRGGCKEGVSMGRKESGSRQGPLEDIKKKRLKKTSTDLTRSEPKARRIFIGVT